MPKEAKDNFQNNDSEPENETSPENIEDKELKEIAAENFNQWNEALKSNDPKQVATLYDKEASFLPTVSGRFKNTPPEVEEYFEHFLTKNPEGAIIEERIQNIDSKSYLHSGLYNFKLHSDEDRREVEARFTFIWKLNEEGQWKIIHHHSSYRPQER